MDQIQKAYSQFEIKAVDEGKRQIRGIATTPSPDRVNDVVLPEGAVFKLPIPFLWQHDHMQPIGNVIEAKVTSKGIEIVAELVSVAAPSQLAARLEEAWQSIKTGLVRGLSIGFSPIKYAFLDNGGVEFSAWSFNELSAVTVPCNVEASITTIKSLSQRPASSGKNGAVKLLDKPVGVPAQKPKPTTPPEGQSMNIQEQLDSFKATLEAKKVSSFALMEKSAKEGRTLDASEAEEFKTLEQEIQSLDEHIARLEKMVKFNVDKAVPVDTSPNSKAVGDNRMGSLPAVAKQHEKLAPGQEFARYVMCLGAAQGDLAVAKSIAETRFPQSERIIHTLKAAVNAGTTTDSTWAAPLVQYNQFAGDFVEYLRPKTIIGRFGQGGIPALRAVPFNVHIRGQTSGGSAGWVGQGAPKPVTKFDFNDVYLDHSKIAAISVLTEDLLRLSNPSAELLVRDSLANAVIERIDTDFVDPTKAAVANVSPASITNGVTPVASSGNDADSIRADIKAAMTKFIVANITPSTAVWIISATRALALSLMRNALGQKEFPDIDMMGGKLEGIPVIVSEYVPSDSDGDYAILANTSDIWLADDNQVVVSASRETAIQMLDNPTNNSATGTATSMVSMFQTNSVAIRAERWINWKKRRAAAVAVISGVHWGE